MKPPQYYVLDKNQDEKGRFQNIPKEKRLKGKSLRF